MASRSLNKVQLIGNLTRDPELRYTPQGTAVCAFGLATNRSWTTENGEKREETEFHRIVAWNKLAELCSQLLFKGRKVYVEGRLQTRTWTAQDGSQRQATEVVIEEMIILDSKQQVGEEPVAAVVPEPAVAAEAPPAPTPAEETPVAAEEKVVAVIPPEEEEKPALAESPAPAKKGKAKDKVEEPKDNADLADDIPF